MKKVIEEIEKIKGVEKVTETGCNELTVQVEKKLRAVKCTNKEQCKFVQSRITELDFYYNGICLNLQGVGHAYESWYVNNNYDVIPFSQYLSDYNLTDEWEKYLIGEAEKRGFVKGIKHRGQQNLKHTSHNLTKLWINETGDLLMGGASGCVYSIPTGKWATIIEPELELISGEIYYIKYHDDKRIVRYDSMDGKHCINIHSQLISDGRFINMAEYGDSLALLKKIPKPATNKQKATLIKSELKNGYLWNGKELIKYK